MITGRVRPKIIEFTQMFIYTLHDPLTSCCCWKLGPLIAKTVMDLKYEILRKSAAFVAKRRKTRQLLNQIMFIE